MILSLKLELVAVSIFLVQVYLNISSEWKYLKIEFFLRKLPFVLV